MTFKKDFPSLEDKAEIRRSQGKDHLTIVYTGGSITEEMYSETVIQKHCLDRKIVKKAIDKFMPALPNNKAHPSRDKYAAIKYILQLLKRELNLK